jgi:uncharacterized membrane protein YbaN (DUF454 family)
MAKKTITLGIAVAVAVLGIFVPIIMALPLFLVAALLIAWALQPKSTEEFVGRLPYVGLASCIVARIHTAH